MVKDSIAVQFQGMDEKSHLCGLHLGLLSMRPCFPSLWVGVFPGWECFLTDAPG